MSRNDQAIRLVKIWVDKIGKSAAVKRLVDCEVPLHTADKVCAGRYTSTPRDLLTKTLLEEMAKDGLTLADVKAS